MEYFIIIIFNYINIFYNSIKLLYGSSADIDDPYNNLIELFKIENINEQSTCSIFIWTISEYKYRPDKYVTI